ncbi:MAG: DUF1080 domain-containing protein [Bacteroidales bacterium]|nr:DUF1080 domain-containing protein [Bacteroidales bacterium]
MRTLIILLAVLLTACSTSKDKPGAPEAAPPEFYMGSWALDLDYENNTAGWLKVTQEDGYLDGELLWRWGSVTPVDFIFVAEGTLFVTRGRDVVRERDLEGNPTRKHHAFNWLNIKRSGDDEIAGMAFFPGIDGVSFEKVSFTGKRIPPAGSPPDLSDIEYGDPINLLRGDNLSEWEMLEKSAANGWSVKDGVLVNDPVQKEGEEHIQYGNIRTKQAFEDFNLTLEVNVPEGSNSGIYLKGIYEIQVSDSYGKKLDSHNMGALYSRITPSVAAEKPAEEWQTFDITLCKRHLTVILNGTTIINNMFVEGVTGGAMTADEFIPGPIYLQGDHGKVSYRNIIIRKIKN